MGPRPLGGRFAELAAQAHDVGARLGIEFFPWANVASLQQGLQLVTEAGHPAGGVVIDTWHIARAGTGTGRPGNRAARTHRRRRARRRGRTRGGLPLRRTPFTAAGTAERATST